MRADWTDRLMGLLIVGLPFHPTWTHRRRKQTNTPDLVAVSFGRLDKTETRRKIWGGKV